MADLRLPAERPAAFEVAVVHAGVERWMRLERHALRAPGAAVQVWHRGRTTTVPAPEPGTYRGTLLDEPGSLVLASLTAEGLWADVFADGEVAPGWGVRPLRRLDRAQPRARHATLALGHDHGLPAACGFDPAAGDGPAAAVQRAIAIAEPLDCLKLCEIAFDADFEYYQLKGSSVAAVVDAVDAIMNEVDFFYARDARITYRVSGYVVRTSPFYAPVDGGDLLELFRLEWNANQTGVQRDIAHLMTAKPGSLIEFGGLAWVGVVCGGFGYGWSMDGANIVGHEVGHNFGAGHCHDTTPCNNMCGACFYIGPNTKDIIEAHRDSRLCLDDAPPYATPLPPYAYPDGLRIEKEELLTLGPTAFDVLRNDDDGNCDLLIVASADTRSALGGKVELSRGTGRAGRDELIYTPPAEVFVGLDTFGYDVRDGSGLRSTGTVSIDSRPRELRAYWTFDDGAGQVATDASSYGNDATAQNPADWKVGVYGGAMRWGGGGQVLDTGAPDFEPPWTVATWVKRKSSAGNAAALIDASDGSVRLEQWFQTGQVGLTRFGVTDASFGYSAPVDVWTHLALVATDGGTDLYVDGAFEASVPVSIRAPMGPLGTTAEPLSAVLDDLRVYAYALDPGEVADLVLSGGPAVAPAPRDGGRHASADLALSWVSGLAADSHDVYFGTDYAAVSSATTGSPEFVGNQTATTYQPGGLAAETTYFWRVDERVGGAALGGAVWQFSLADSYRWPLDETGGSVAGEASGLFDGTYFGTPGLDQPGATAGLGRSVLFDGFDDRMRIPPLNLDSNAVTITVWLRRSGPQDSFAGIVLSRDGSTTAGLNFGSADELRYHWNNDGATWSWDSGLVVPDDEWVFAALVVEPSRATLHLGQGGVLSSAQNAVNHDVEEFDGNVDVGRDPGFSTRYFQGFLDDVRIFDAALSRGQLEALYQADLGG